MGVRRIAIRAAWGYLALVLLLAPVLGLMHGLVHGPGDKRQAAHAAQAADRGQPHAQGWLDALFSAHGKASDCRVYDQLGHSDALTAPPLLALPLLLLAAFVFPFTTGEVTARRAALFEARGPPLAR